jgi:uncharacterized protein YgiM (DUF1202 family)
MNSDDIVKTHRFVGMFQYPGEQTYQRRKNAMKSLSVRLIITIFILSMAAVAFADIQKVWVSSEDATLQAERSLSSETVAEVRRGTELTVLTFENRWYHVTAPDGKTGWIFRGKVSSEPVAGIDEDSGSGGIGGLLGGLTGSTIEAQSADSSRSIRGLSPEAEEYARQTGTPAESQAALDMVLSQTVDKTEIDQFLKEGKIGEYAD